jgi:hypothetical protein
MLCCAVLCCALQATLQLRAAYDLLHLRHPTWTEQRLVEKSQEEVFGRLYEQAYAVSSATKCICMHAPSQLPPSGVAQAGIPENVALAARW